MSLSSASPPLFPPLSSAAVLTFQFSSWFPKFSALSIKSTIIRPLPDGFSDYLDSDGVFLPEGSEDIPTASPLLDPLDHQESDDEEEDGTPQPARIFSFPELDERMRNVISNYGAVFPKLNFSSPRDAAWVLPASSPLKCYSPADVYFLLKSSDFILHDLDSKRVFEGVDPDDTSSPYSLELVLRKWYPVDCSRELRCFVRGEVLIGISQRDPNYYDFWNEPDIQEKVIDSVISFWDNNIRGNWEATQGNYTFDLLLTRDLSRAHIVDFNPYAPRTDPLLFTYDELLCVFGAVISSPDAALHFRPELKVIDSRSHPAAIRNAPTHQHNMVPIEALTMGQGRTVEDFSQMWAEEIKHTIVNQ